jgi:hypothetical protein
MSFWGFATGHRDHVGLLFAGELGRCAWPRTLIESTHPLLNKSCSRPLNGRHTNVERRGDLVISQAVSRFEQDARASDFASRRFSMPSEGEELLALIVS